MAYTKAQRSEAAKKGWKNRKDRYWITGASKHIGNVLTPVDKVPVGHVDVPINR